MCICVGVRYIPLRTPGGKSASHVGLFVKIGIKKLSHKYTSASGICAQDPNALLKKFSPPTLPEMCDVTLHEHAVDVEHKEEYNDDEMHQPKPANIGNTSLGKMLMQPKDTSTCSVEIHSNRNVEDSDEINVGENTKL